MKEAPSQPLIVRTFMTHEMKDEDIAALSTGREQEFQRIMDDIERSRRASPGPLQHVVLYGSRGFGKSFMMRRVQIAVGDLETDQGKVFYLLLPEEQHNLQRSPHAFLDTIRHSLEHLEGDGDAGFEAALFQWPSAGEEAKRWDNAAKQLEEAIDEALGDAKGLVIVVVENFDILLSTLFRVDADEQRLRRWLDRRKNRVMLLATATGTVDIDYDKPLFQAFDSIRLSPWTTDDCITYFNRQRRRDGRAPLTPEQEAKARAIAEFIGGTPRLAQLLADVLETQDALTVAQTMSALADKLAEYYRRRIEDLPSLARGLLDALIRGGEPASQTSLAERVRASGQSDIARVMGELQRADIVRGRPAPDSRETLYSVTDRVFVHYYRLRQGSRAARLTPLSTILDFLKSFYSRDEQREQALRHLEAGQSAEAELFSRLALEDEPPPATDYQTEFAERLALYFLEAPHPQGRSAEAVADALDKNPAEEYKSCLDVAAPSPVAEALLAIVKAQALHRLGHDGKASSVLQESYVEAAASDLARVMLGTELAHLDNGDADWFGQHALELKQHFDQMNAPGITLLIAPRLFWPLYRRGDLQEAVEVSSGAASVAKMVGDGISEGAALRQMALALSDLDRDQEALEAAERAAALAEQSGSTSLVAISLRQAAVALIGLGRPDEAVEAADKAIGLARSVGAMRWEGSARRVKGHALASLGRPAEAMTEFSLAAEAAAQVGDCHAQVMALTRAAGNASQIKRHEQAVEMARIAADLAEKLDQAKLRASALRQLGYSLGELRRHEEAVEVDREALELTRRAKLPNIEVNVLRNLAYSLGALGIHQEAIEAADRAYALAVQLEAQLEQIVASRHKAFSLAAVGRVDEALESYANAIDLAVRSGRRDQEAAARSSRAFALVRANAHEDALAEADEAARAAAEIDDKTNLAEAQRAAAVALYRLGRFAEAWDRALEAAQLARETGSLFELVYALMVAVGISAQIRRPGMIPLAREWIEISRSTEDASIPPPRQWVEDMFAGAALADDFVGLDGLLEQHGGWLAEIAQLNLLETVGGAVALKAADEGRAAAYKMMAELIPRLSKFMAGRTADSPEAGWIVPVATGFAQRSRDPGLSRDVAGLFSSLGEAGAQTSSLLLELAKVDEAPEPEAALARLDPDLATAIRRLRRLPDPKPQLARRKSRRRGGGSK